MLNNPFDAVQRYVFEIEFRMLADGVAPNDIVRLSGAAGHLADFIESCINGARYFDDLPGGLMEASIHLKRYAYTLYDDADNVADAVTPAQKDLVTAHVLQCCRRIWQLAREQAHCYPQLMLIHERMTRPC